MIGDRTAAFGAYATGLAVHPGNAKLVKAYRAFLSQYAEPEILQRAQELIDGSIEAFEAAATVSDCKAMWQHLSTVVNLDYAELAGEMVHRYMAECSIGESGAHPVETYRVCILVLRKNQHFEEAWQLVQRALAEHPDHPRLVVEAGCVVRHAGNHMVASDLFASALAVHPGNAKLVKAYRAFLSQYAEPEILQRAQELIDGSIEAFEAAATVSDCKAMWQHLSTVVNLGYAELAGEMVHRYMAECSIGESGAHPVQTYRVCILVLRKNQHFEEAWQLVQRALAEHPDHPRLVVEAGRVAGARRDVGESLGYWIKLAGDDVRALSPRNGAALATALVSGDQIIEAHRLCEELKGIHGDHPLLARTHAKVLMRAVWDHYNMHYVESAPGWAARLSSLLDTRELCAAVLTGLETYDNDTRGALLYRQRATKSLSVVLFGPREISDAEYVHAGDTLMKVVFGQSAELNHPLVQAARHALSAPPSDRAEASAILESAFEDVVPECGLGSESFDLLYRPLLWQARFALAHRARAAASEFLMFEASRSDDVSKVLDATLSACEFAAPEIAVEWSSSLSENQRISAIRRRGIAAYQQLLAGNREPLRTLWTETLTPEEKRLAEYLQHRSVAIVAPAPGEAQNGSEIDEFDIVIRPNAYQGVKPSAYSRHGSRTHVCSFNASRSRRLRHEEGLGEEGVEIAAGIEVVLHKARYVKCLGPDIKFEVVRSRVKDLDQYTAGHGTHIPHLVFYLLGFSPARIKLFNSNFFLSETAHEASYRNLAAGDVGPFAYNDMIDVGHGFVRAVWMHGLVEADVEGARVLSLDTSEYMSGMEQLYRGV